MDARTRQFGLAGFMRQAFLWALLPMLVLFLIAPSVADAQVVTNITPSALPPCPGPCGPGVTIVAPPPTGGTVTTITGGARPGNGPNLFHSFGRFDVGTGDVANFFNETSLPTSNILSRVTGGNPSQIYGTIQTTDFPGANLFLMNPAGVLFGATAVLDLGAVSGSAVRQPGSFYATTADYLNLGDATGTSPFYADPAQTSVLSVAPVVAFGFLGTNAASIAIQGGNLEVPDGKTLSFIGGPGVFTPDTGVPVLSGVTMTAGRLSAPNGLIYMETVTAPGEIPLPTLSGNPLGSPVSFPGSENAVIFIQSGELVMKSASLLTATTGPTSGEPIGIDVEVAGQFTMQNASALSSSTTGEGQAGAINVSASTLAMDASSITTETSGDGNGGNLTANVGTLSLTTGAAINSNNFSFGLGQGGNVTVQGLGGAGSSADSVTLSNFAGISTVTLAPGRGGNLQLHAGTLTLESSSSIQTGTFGGGGVGGDMVLNAGTVSLTDGASIQTATQNFNLGGGQGGNVIIQGLQGTGSAAETVTLSSGSRLSTTTSGGSDGGQLAITSKLLTLDGAFTTINSAVNDVGRGGDLVVSVQQASLSGGATIIAQTNSGDLNAQPGPTLTVQGLEGVGSMADSVVLSGLGSGIISDSFGTARAGDVAVHAKTVTIADEAVIQAGTAFTSAAGGNVTIEADSVDISGGGHITSQAQNSDAGQITITANTLNLDNGSIATNSISKGQAGDVVVNVGSLSLSQGGNINTSTNGSGRAGDITIGAGAVTLSGGSKISSASIGTEPTISFDGTTEPPGQAGNITINATGSFTSDASTIATSAEANHGGDIIIKAQSVGLSNGTLITANSNAPLKVTKLVLDQDGLLVPQVVGDGNAGNIIIKSASTFLMQNSSMTTAASQASGGQIKIIAPEMVRLVNSNIITSVAGSSTDTFGGNISIDPQFVILQNSQILAQAFAGTGGKIDIISGVKPILDPSSQIDASSTLGISGTVTISAPGENVAGQLTPMSQQLSSAAALLAQQCAARAANGKFSTFVVAGREGLPVEPGGFLASPSLMAELLRSSLTGWDQHTHFPAVTGTFQEYDARPIQLAKYGDACH